MIPFTPACTEELRLEVEGPSVPGCKTEALCPTCARPFSVKCSPYTFRADGTPEFMVRAAARGGGPAECCRALRVCGVFCGGQGSLASANNSPRINWRACCLLPNSHPAPVSCPAPTLTHPARCPTCTQDREAMFAAEESAKARGEHLDLRGTFPGMISLFSADGGATGMGDGAKWVPPRMPGGTPFAFGGMAGGAAARGGGGSGSSRRR